jgi:SOS-response transcriptional repressor LexA
MVAEAVDWRLAEYRARFRPNDTAFEARLSHNRVGPILMLPARNKTRSLPEGETLVTLPDGRRWRFRFVTIACNVAHALGDQQNRLPELLRGWFGDDAGQPGTNHRVRFLPIPWGWRVEPVRRGDAQVIPLPPRVRLPAFTSLRVAAGWLGDAVDTQALEPDDAVELPGPLPTGCFAVRATGQSMEGWRTAIRDGDWLVCEPSHGIGFAAVEGEVVVVARGEDEATTFHVKRIVRGEDGVWLLRSDNAATPPMVVEARDRLVALVRKVAMPEELASAPAE